MLDWDLVLSPGFLFNPHVCAVLSNRTPYDTEVFPSAFTVPKSLIASCEKGYAGATVKSSCAEFWSQIYLSGLGSRARYSS